MAVKRNQQQDPQQGQQQNQQQNQQDEVKGQEGGTAEAIQQQRRANAEDPDQKQEAKERGQLTTDLSEPHTGEPRYFEGSVLKINKDGEHVMSDHLEEGDRLPRSEAETNESSGLDPAADY